MTLNLIDISGVIREHADLRKRYDDIVRVLIKRRYGGKEATFKAQTVAKDIEELCDELDCYRVTPEGGVVPKNIQTNAVRICTKLKYWYTNHGKRYYYER